MNKTANRSVVATASNLVNSLRSGHRLFAVAHFERSLKKMISNDSGQYRIEHGELSYRSEVYASWKLPISEITLIGEYTNEDGPMADDYFLVFLSVNEPGWFEASFYGEGRDEILKELSDILDSELSCGLAHSTAFTSQMIWPDDRKGKRVFDFQSSGWFKNRQALAPEVQNKQSSEQVSGGNGG